MTRARAKLLGEQVNSLLIEYNVCDNENFILPKSMHLCMIRVVDNTSVGGGPKEQQGVEHDVPNGAREEREACARGEDEETSTGGHRNIRVKLDRNIRVATLITFWKNSDYPSQVDPEYPSDTFYVLEKFGISESTPLGISDPSDYPSPT